ncbi:hypothetical protein [Kitasatospora sp. NPDC087315]|uniref:hypothetical protein n=1 Tax=Kitasatospora sp. NPDC087315 TaxID=3364069 RepID=UPI003823308D
MAIGYKMLEARTSQGAPVRASKIASLPEDAKPLRCRYCPSKVEGVGAYFKGKDGPNPTKVGAHFRLAGGQRHEAGCAYNPAEVVTAIARGSHGLAQAEEDGRLRLVMPGDPGASKAKPPQPTDGEAAAGTRSLTFTTTRPSIPPALNSAAKIVHFLQLHDFDPEAVKLFRVVYGDSTKPILWKRFCYHPDTAADLHQVLTHRPGPAHPVAFYGTVKRTSETGGSHAYATLATGQRPHDGGDAFSVRLRTAHPELLEQLRPGRHVLAIGAWNLWPEANEARLWVEAHWQLAFWDTDPATGAPHGISCPKPLPPTAIRPVPARRHPRPARPRTAPPARRATPAPAAAKPIEPADTAPAEAPEPQPTAQAPTAAVEAPTVPTFPIPPRPDYAPTVHLTATEHPAHQPDTPQA